MKSKLAIVSFIIPLTVILFYFLLLYHIIDIHTSNLILFISLAPVIGIICSLVSFYLMDKYKLEGKIYAILGLVLNLILFFLILLIFLSIPYP